MVLITGMTLITGHRGARNPWPENSLTGFRKTLGFGVDAIAARSKPGLIALIGRTTTMPIWPNPETKQ